MSAADGRSALVLGGSGLVGGHCVDLLLEDGAWGRVVAPGRRPLGREHPRLEAPVVDFDRLDEHPELFRVDDVFCCLGTTIRKAGSEEAFRRVDHDLPLQAGRRAREADASSFLIVTALGADPESRVFYNRAKGEVERDAAALGFERTVILRPSLLLGGRDESRPAEAVGQAVMGALRWAFVGPLRRYAAIPGRDVARAMVRLAKEAGPGVRVVESDEIARLAESA